jgi:protein O-mannosyl-transferase
MASNPPHDPAQRSASPKVVDLLPPRAAIIAAAALTVAVFAIYSPALNFQFILDDHRFTNDPRIQSAGHVWEYFTSFAWSQTTGGPLSFFRPIFVSWLRLNYILAGDSPWGWHFLSLAKHAAAAFLLGLLVWKLLRDRAAALIAAGLFALHPAQTESVAWATVPDPLMSIAAFATFLFYFKHAKQFSVKSSAFSGKLNRRARKQAASKPAPNASLAWIVASATAFLFALMAKETAAVLPVAIFALAFLDAPQAKPTSASMAKSKDPATPSEETSTASRRLLVALLQTLPFFVAAAFYFLLRFHALGGHLSSQTQSLPAKTLLLSLPATLWFYVTTIVWPTHSHAFADPNLADVFSVHGVLLPALGVLIFGAVIASLCVVAWKKSERRVSDNNAQDTRRAILLGAALLSLPILPALNLNALNPGDFLHGRYTYLPLAGLALLVAVGYCLIAPNLRRIFLGATALVLIVFSVLTIQQEQPWKDDLTLFTWAHQIAPHNVPVDQSLVRAHVQVALGLDETGQCDQAIPIFNDAIRQYPQDWYAWAGLGECFAKLNNLPEAEQALRRASELANQPRVTQEWQMVRKEMGLPSTPSQ